MIDRKSCSCAKPRNVTVPSDMKNVLANSYDNISDIKILTTAYNIITVILETILTTFLN